MVMLKNPSCRVIVFNYIEREGSSLPKRSLIPPILNKRIEITDDVIAIQTSKSKSAPSGNFSIVLSPSSNWVSFISPGSWVAILMDEKNISEKQSRLFDESSLKFIGRVDSVRASRSVNQTSGAWETTYSIVGRDWCSCFESQIYIDQIAAAVPGILGGTPIDSSFGQALRLKFDNKARELYSKGVPSSSDVADAIFDIWGKQGSAFGASSILSPELSDRFLPTASLNIPLELSIALGATAINLSDLIKRQHGVLKKPNPINIPFVKKKIEYQRNRESVGWYDIRGMLGINTLWQLLQSTVTVGGINEIFGDISFNSSNPELTLYKRVRPFSLSGGSSLLDSALSGISSLATGGDDAASLLKSNFFYLPKTEITAEEIFEVDVGTNWSDVVNFIEILPDLALFKNAKSNAPQLKAQNADFSTGSYAISGFKPIIISTAYFPENGGKPDAYGHNKWLPILREWFFDTHKMLNGSITISGKSGYTEVGSNILFPANAIANSEFVTASGGGYIPSAGGNTHILAHVESVSHSFSKNQTSGANSFTTSISFVRGIMTNSDGASKLAADGYGIDSKSPSAPPANSNTQSTK
jgi:hypothetical protein